MNALRPTPDYPDKGYYVYFLFRWNRTGNALKHRRIKRNRWWRYAPRWYSKIKHQNSSALNMQYKLKRRRKTFKLYFTFSLHYCLIRTEGIIQPAGWNFILYIVNEPNCFGFEYFILYTLDRFYFFINR